MVKFKQIIKNVGTGPISSIGEHLYHNAEPLSIEKHNNGWDFTIPNSIIGVDVKTTRKYININRPTDGKLHKAASKNENEIRANVCIYNDCISVHYDDIIIRIYTWKEFELFVKELRKWKSWSNPTIRTITKVRHRTHITYAKSDTYEFWCALADLCIKYGLTKKTFQKDKTLQQKFADILNKQFPKLNGTLRSADAIRIDMIGMFSIGKVMGRKKRGDNRNEVSQKIAYEKGLIK